MLAAPDPVLLVDGNAVIRNLALVRRSIRPGRLIAVVKDNAYGHGMVPVARVLAGEGVDAFAVGSVEEACVLQAAGVPGEILNLRLFRASEARRIVSRGIVQAIFTRTQADLLTTAARECGRMARVHVKVDTGLRRFGVPADDAAEFLSVARASEQLDVGGVFSMLAEDPATDREQIARFDALRTSVGVREGETWHLLSSAGLARHADARLPAARVGCLLCGFAPGDDPVESLSPVVRLEAEVIDVRPTRRGDRHGFHGRWRIERGGHAVWIGAGIRHGLRESIVEGGEVLVGGRRAPVRQIGAEYLVAEVVRGPVPVIGDRAVLLGSEGGESIGLDAFAGWMGAGRYTVLQALRSRVRRHLIGGTRGPAAYGR